MNYLFFNTKGWYKKVFLILVVCVFGISLAFAEGEENEETPEPTTSSQEAPPPAGTTTTGERSEASATQRRALPSSLPQVERDVAELQRLSSNTGYHLNQCRRSCLESCREDGEDDCSEEKCDETLCQTARKNHDQAQASLEVAEQHLLRLQTAKTAEQNQALNEGSKSALHHTRKAQDNMGLYIGMGVGTTALLTYMSYKCCTSDAAFGGGSSFFDINRFRLLAGLSQVGQTCFNGMIPQAQADTSATIEMIPQAQADTSATTEILPCSQFMCAVYVAGAAAAGIQTYKMVQQKKKLGKIEKALSDGSSGYESPDEDPPPNFTSVPGCTGEVNNTQTCRQTYCAINPEHRSCQPAGDGPPPPGGDGSATTFAISPPGDSIRTRLSNIYVPKGGWPDNENPWESELDTANLSPQKRAEIDRVMAPHNSEVQGWLESMGANPIEEFEPEFSLADAGFQEEEDSPSSTSASSPVAGLPAGPAFTAQPVGNGPLPSSSSQGKKSKAKKKKGNLAKQMNAMLQKYYGRGSEKKDPYAGQSVPVGASGTPVGAKDDNIFLRSHRRHQALIKSGAFVERSSLDTDTSDSL